MATTQNMKDHKKDEAAEKASHLQKSEDKYRLLFENVHDGIYQSTMDGKILTANPALVKMLGYDSEEELKKMNIGRDLYVNPSQRDSFTQELKEKDRLRDVELTLKRKDGKHIIVLENSHTIRDDNGDILYYEGTLTEITGRKQAEKKIELAYEQLRQIIDLVPSYIFAKDIDGRFLLANKAVADVFGLAPDEIQGKNDSDYGATKEQVDWYRKADLSVIGKGEPMQIPEEQVLRKDGSLGWFQTVKIPYRHPGCDKPAVLGVATEITERKEVENELRKSEERFRKLFESHSAVKLIIDLDTDSIADANKAAAEFYGWSVSKLKGMKLSDISGMSAEKFKLTLDKARRNKEIFFETLTRLSDGSFREIEVFTSRIEIEGKSYLHSIIHDITEKKKMLADLIAAKEKAEESDRLKTAFLHNISHEIRTPMNAIVGFTSLLESSELSEDVRRQYVNLIFQSSNQLLSIISDIVDISNIETGIVKMSLSKVNINTMIKNIFDQYYLRAEQHNIKFRYHTSLYNDKAEIMTDDIKLIQVISNLLNNAFKFTKEGLVEYGYTIKTNYVEFFVKDTGIGIDRNKQQMIFERFYQVENAICQKIEGIGLGLSISKAYVELMGGKIWTVSQSGKGTAFYFTIPFNKSGNHDQVKKKGTKSDHKKVKTGKTILIAEDDSSNFLLLKEMLSAYKSNIFRAVTGLEAVSKCQELDKIDLILMDIKMPVMDGYEALKLIKEYKPGIPVIAITSNAQETDREKILASGFVGYVSKPIDTNRLNELLKLYL